MSNLRVNFYSDQKTTLSIIRRCDDEIKNQATSPKRKIELAKILEQKQKYLEELHKELKESWFGVGNQEGKRIQEIYDKARNFSEDLPSDLLKENMKK